MSLKEKLRAISLDLPNLIESINQIEGSSGDNNNSLSVTNSNKLNSIKNSLEIALDELKDLI